jgi:hypothetical protein
MGAAPLSGSMAQVDMNVRISRWQTFLTEFERLNAATGNAPKMLSTFDQTTDEIRSAARRMHDYLDGSVGQREMFHSADKVIVRAPEQFENSWNEFKQFWQPRINYLAMCEYEPDWPRDSEEHLKIYAASGVILDDGDDEFLPGFHDGPAAIRQALDYLRNHDECRAGLAALKYLVDTVGLDLAAIMERWEKVPHVFMPKHVADQQQMNNSGPLTDLFDDASRAYVCGATAAAFAMCRALLETVLKQSYLLGEFAEEDESGRKPNISLGGPDGLVERASRRHRSIHIEKDRIKRLIHISNGILHGNSLTALDAEANILHFFKILKTLIQNAPAPR